MENISETGKKGLKIVYGDLSLGIHGEAFHYIFSYQTGGLESLAVNGIEWLYRTPQPTFWRATTDNDRGNKFSYKSAMWLGADLFMDCQAVRIAIDGEDIGIPRAPENNRFTADEYANEVKIEFCCQTATIPSTTVRIEYTVGKTGRITVDVHYAGVKGLPELPVFGIRFIMPTKAAGYRYEGLSSETYPDRKAGGTEGIYDIDGLPVTPYLVPQDCGVHMDTKWVEIYRNTTLDNTQKNIEMKKIRFSCKNEKFAFSCLPYTAEELESALHQEELPVPRRTVLCILGAVRGVGGIDSWGTDVEEPYRICAEADIDYSFVIELPYQE